MKAINAQRVHSIEMITMMMMMMIMKKKHVGMMVND